MLLRNSIGACVAAMAILFTTAFNNNVLAVPIFAPGDFITFRAVDWGDAPVLATPTPFSTVYPLGLRVGLLGVPNRYYILFSSGPATQGYLPTAGASVALTQSYVDPVAVVGGLFSGELTALHLNVDFNDAGVIGGTLSIPFGDLTLTNLSGLPALEGVRVRDFAETADRAIAGDATGFSLDDLTMISGLLNGSFLQGPSAFAEDHLRFTQTPTQVPEPATAGMVLLGLVALGLVRRRSRV